MGIAKEFLSRVKPIRHDFIARSEGSLVLVAPQNDEAREWLARTAPEDATFWGSSLVVEPRYLRGVIQAMEDDGWSTNVMFAQRQEGQAKNFLRAVRPQAGSFVDIQIGEPPGTAIAVPVKWAPNMVMVGDEDIPGVNLSLDVPTPPELRPGQWQWMLEVIEYALNEGPVFSEVEEADEVEDSEDLSSENDPHGELRDMRLPAYRWAYRGGEQKFYRDRERAGRVEESDISGVTRFLRKGKAKRALKKLV